MSALAFWERCVYAIFGAIFGAAYGAFLGLLMTLVPSGEWNILYVYCAAAVFATLAFIIGPFIVDAIVGVFHLVGGILAALPWFGTPVPDGDGTRTRPFLSALFWFGIATGIAVYLARRLV